MNTLHTDSIATKYRQIKEIEGVPFNHIGSVWNMESASNEHVILRKDNMFGIGVDKQELHEYFAPCEDEISSSHDDEDDCDCHDPTKDEVDREDKIKKGNQVEYIGDMTVIRNGVATIVILEDGSKGVSKCMPQDEYDEEKGFEIAYTKAEIKRLKRILKELCK